MYRPGVLTVEEAVSYQTFHSFCHFFQVELTFSIKQVGLFLSVTQQEVQQLAEFLKVRQKKGFFEFSKLQ